MKGIAFGLTVLSTVAFSAQAVEPADKPLAESQFEGSTLSFTSERTPERSMITISGPDGFYATQEASWGLPKLSLHDYEELPDGRYSYEMTMAVGEPRLHKDKLNNGRGENDSVYVRDSITLSGTFVVKNGQVLAFRELKEPRYTSINR